MGDGYTGPLRTNLATFCEYVIISKQKAKSTKHKGNSCSPAHSGTAPHPTFLPSPLSSGKTQRSGGRWGAAAQAQSRSPRRVSGKSRLRSLGPGPPRQPLSAAGNTAALAPPRCRLFRQLGLFLLSSPATAPRPYLRTPHPSPPLVWPVGCCRWGFACPHVETAGPAGVCGCPPPPALPPSGVW